MDEIEQRLKQTSQECIDAYNEWRNNEHNDDSDREKLQDAVHELRKVSSRLEIEIAVSERNQMSKKPIPVPHHRAKKGGKQISESDSSMEDFLNDDQQGGYFRDNGGNNGNSGNSGTASVHVKRTRRRPSPPAGDASQSKGNSES